jgi:hypothetical protein
VTTQSSAPGERHEHLSAHVGEVAIRTWRGHPANPASEHGGVGWLRAVQWLPYQQYDFVTPGFPGYTSGHSGFSRAAAEGLASMTGDPYFPGGLAQFTAGPDGFTLGFEFGPSQPTTLQWATYADAADEAGLSRVFGGIHPSFDDYPGRIIGYDVGAAAFAHALAIFQGRAGRGAPLPPAPVPALQSWALALLGLMIFGLVGRRLRRAAAHTASQSCVGSNNSKSSQYRKSAELPGHG